MLEPEVDFDRCKGSRCKGTSNVLWVEWANHFALFEATVDERGSDHRHSDESSGDDKSFIHVRFPQCKLL